jgi:hypothetical protein
MTFAEVYEAFSEDESLEWDRVDHKRSQRPDLHAFLLLDELVPGKQDIVSCAEHDQIWLGVEPEELDGKATQDQMIELIRCGVMYDEDIEVLSMFV